MLQKVLTSFFIHQGGANYIDNHENGHQFKIWCESEEEWVHSELIDGWEYIRGRRSLDDLREILLLRKQLDEQSKSGCEIGEFKDGDFCRIFRTERYGQVLLMVDFNENSIPCFIVDFKFNGLRFSFKNEAKDDSEEAFERFELALKRSTNESVESLCLELENTQNGANKDE